MPKDYSVKYFKEEVNEEYLDKRRESVNKNKEHNDQVCLIAGSFYGDNDLVRKTGFKTVLLEPLFDVESYLGGNQSKNFDIMLYNQVSKHSIFVEVKTSVGSIKRLLEDFEDAKTVVEENFDKEISDRIRLKKDEHNYLDFVLVVPRGQSLQLKERIKQEGRENIIIWELSSLTKPVVEMIHEITSEQDMINKKQTHTNKNFRKMMYEGIILGRSIKIFNFLLNSDPIQKLTYFIPLIRNLNLKKFNFIEIKNKLFDGEKSFLAYANPDNSKEFMYKEIIKQLKEIKGVKTITESGDILLNEYEVIIERRLGETILKRKIEEIMLKEYLKKNEAEIKQMVLNRYNQYHGQKILE